MKRRRGDRIFKGNRGPLTEAERTELENLQALSLARMQRDFPGPTLIDEQLKRIEEILRAEIIEKT